MGLAFLSSYYYKCNFSTVHNYNCLPLMLMNCNIWPKSTCIKWGPWENDGNALGRSFLLVSKNWILMAPSFLTFFDPGQIEAATAFSLTLVVHTLCLEQLNGYTHYSSLCTSLCTHVLESHFPPSPQLFGLSPKPASDSFRCYILVRIPIGPNVWLIFFNSGPSQLSDKTGLWRLVL